MRRVLVLEDKEEIRQFISINLRRTGFHVIEASTGEEALEIFNEDSNIEIAVLDIMLPGIDGFEVCKKIREKDKVMGIIMLTAKMQEINKINGLALGADDYVVKPFSPSELVARIDALCRRVDMTKNKKVDEIQSGLFKLNLDEHRFFKNDKLIELTKIEFDIMEIFLTNPNKALSRNYILDKVWGENYFGNTKVVDVNIMRIRHKIEEDPTNPKYIITVWGYGYRWTEDD